MNRPLLRWMIACNSLLPFATYPAVAGMRKVQRRLKSQNPHIGEVDIDDIIDNRYIGKLDESGFVDRIFGK